MKKWVRRIVWLAAMLTGWLGKAEVFPLGVVFQGETTAGELVVRNAGDAALSLNTAEVSCDCLKLAFTPRQIAPKDSARIPFTYRSQAAGRFSIDVQLRGAEPAAPGWSTTVTVFVAEKAWLATPRALLAGEGEKPAAVFVDTRAPEMFNRLHVPRSLNIPAFALRAQEQLKSARVVLVDEGFSSDLLEQVRLLRQQGFSQVVVLEGGLAAWSRAGGALEGPDGTRLSVTSISPADVLRTAGDGEWRILAVDAKLSGLPGGDAALLLGQWEEVSRELRSVAQPVPNRSATRLLVIAASDATYARIEDRFGKGAAGQLYYLRGGSAAWENHLAVYTAMGRGTQQITQVRRSAGVPPSSGGCSSCGAK